ncbi:MAG: integrase [Alphaproteobacteria bacterium]|nr:integrase [Alphaproteobacteria bacterium]
MTTMIAELYDALISAGAPEDKARKAAETVAAYETRFTGLDGRLAKIDADMTSAFAKVHGEINLLKWMLSILLAGVASLVLKTFFT